MTSSGKVQKFNLRELLTEKAKDEGGKNLT